MCVWCMCAGVFVCVCVCLRYEYISGRCTVCILYKYLLLNIALVTIMLVQHDHTLTFASTHLTPLPYLTKQNMDIIFTCQVHPFVASGWGGGEPEHAAEWLSWTGPHILHATSHMFLCSRGGKGEEVLSDLCTPTYSHVCTVTHTK